MLETTIDILRDSTSGCSCYFLQWGGKGIKVYKHEEERDRAYANQFRLSALGLSPKVYFKDSVQVGETTYYAYETELAEVLQSSKREAMGDKWAAHRERFYKAIPALSLRLKDIGAIWWDDHAGNIGFIDGESVLIDTGDDLFNL